MNTETMELKASTIKPLEKIHTFVLTAYGWATINLGLLSSKEEQEQYLSALISKLEALKEEVV